LKTFFSLFSHVQWDTWKSTWEERGIVIVVKQIGITNSFGNAGTARATWSSTATRASCATMNAILKAKIRTASRSLTAWGWILFRGHGNANAASKEFKKTIMRLPFALIASRGERDNRLIRFVSYVRPMRERRQVAKWKMFCWTV